MSRRHSQIALVAMALVAGVGVAWSPAARAGDNSTASAAAFWSQHANGAGWTIGQATYHPPTVSSAQGDQPYALTGGTPREDASQFWSKYVGQQFNLGNAVLTAPAAR